MANEAKVVAKTDRQKFEAEGWTYARDVDADRVVMTRAQVSSVPRRKSTAGAFIDIDVTGNFFILRTPYDPDFVDELKVKLDYSQRKWDKDMKVWKVGRGGWRDAAGLVKKHYGEDKVTYSPAAEAALVELMEDELASPDLIAYATLGVRSDAPVGVIHAAYMFIESCYMPMPEGYTQLHPADIPDVEDARQSYARICKHRKITPHPEVAGIVFEARAGQSMKMGDYVDAMQHPGSGEDQT
jgi:hypothetical protein